jgi:uncharacterized protein YqjF (DUF2071 family)
VSTHGPSCPHEVATPVMVHDWERVTFLHWRFDPAAVQRLLPPWLEVQTLDGGAWVGLVPFFMRVALPGTPSAPWLSRFCETNVRTYVTDPSGTSGIWFFSLDAARLAAVVTARATYRLPYYWSSMRLDQDGDVIRYHCARRWPRGCGTPRSRVEVRVGQPWAPAELTEFDHFLTARWVLFSDGRRSRLARAWHPPWPLHRAEVLAADDLLLRAAGLPPAQGAPVAHFSPGVRVRIGAPEPAAGGRLSPPRRAAWPGGPGPPRGRRRPARS